MLISILITFIIVISAIGYGRLILRNRDEELSLVLQFGVGAWGMAHLVFLAGLFSGLYTTTLLVIILPGSAICFQQIWRDRASLYDLFMTSRPKLSWHWLIALLCLILALAAFSGTLTSPSHRDSLIYHLALPKIYLEKHQWIEIEHSIFSYYPGLAEALYTLNLGLGGKYPALVHWFFGFACLLGVSEVGRQIGLKRQSRWLCVLALLATPIFWAEMTWSYIDLANTFYWTLVVLCFLKWMESRTRLWLVLLGLFIGAANCCKYSSLILFPIVFLGILVEVKNDRAQPIHELVITILTPLVVGFLAVSPWWLKNIYLTGNPLFPFFWNFFPTVAAGWDAERAVLFQVMLGRFGTADKGILGYILAPFLVFITGEFDAPLHFDGKIGPYYLLVWFLLYFVKNLPRKIIYLSSLLGIYLIYWSLSSQQARFLLVILPIMSLLIGYLVEFGFNHDKDHPKRSGVLGYSWVGSFFLCIVLSTISLNIKDVWGVYRNERYYSVLSSKFSLEEYLAQKLPYYEVYKYINDNLSNDAHLLLVMTGNQGFYLDREYYSDSFFEHHTLSRILQESRSADEMVDTCRKNGWTHLLIQPIYFNRVIEPSLTIDVKLRLESFFKHKLHLLANSGPFQLYEIPEKSLHLGRSSI